MKIKSLLFSMIIGVSLFSFGQKNKEATLMNLVPRSMSEYVIIDDIDNGQTQNDYIFNKAVAGVPFSTSGNAYTVTAGKKMNADSSSHRVLYTHRGGGTFGATADDIKMSMTPDFGVTWDSVLISSGDAGKKLRYPGGVLFRPESDGMLYVVSSGGVTDGNGWTSNYFASARIDGANMDFQTIDYPANVDLFHVNEFLTALPNGNLFVLGKKLENTGTELSPNYEVVDYSIFKFEWDNVNKKFDYASTAEIAPTFHDSMPPVQPYGMAFSKDGSVGYFWMTGMDPVDHPNETTQPIVWKTTDDGDTWNMMPIYDFSTVQGLKDYVWPLRADTTRIRPWFKYGYTLSEKDVPGIVDNDGNLHLIVNVVGGYSEHPDSLDYTYTYEPNKLFHLYTTSTGDWEAKVIDSLKTKVQYLEEGQTGVFGDFSLDHRVHIALSDDGEKVFAIWADSETYGGVIDENELPNLKAWGHDFGADLATNSKNFTYNTMYDGMIIYMNASDMVLFNDNKYKIPVVYIEPSLSGDILQNPITHVYVQDVYFVESDFVTNPYVENIENNNTISVSQNYPNPFNDITKIEVNTEKIDNISLEILNILGQVVYREDVGEAQVGKHIFTIDGNAFTPGVYLYNVKVGNNSITKKMIIK